MKKIALLLALCFVGVCEAEACVCSGSGVSDREEAAAEFQSASVVFEGEVLPGGQEISAWNGKPALKMIRFRVTKSYKGTLDDILEVSDTGAGTDCGFGEPKPGTRFFVYGFGAKSAIQIQACSRTASLDSAGADIRFARNEPPTKEDLAPPGEKWRLNSDPTLETRGAIVKGIVRRADGGDVSSVFITLWDGGEEGRRIGVVGARQKVNQDGSFEIRFLRPGEYNVTAEDFPPDRRAAGKCEGEYGNVVLAERQVRSHLSIRLACKVVKDDAPR